MIATMGLEAWQLTDEQLAVGLTEAFAEKARIEAEAARLTAIAMERDLPHRLGHASARTLITNTTKVSVPEAGRTVKRAEAMGADTQASQRAWATGQINSEQFQVIATAISELPEWAAAEKPIAEEHLLKLATEFKLDDLQRLANRILEVIDPDGAEEHLGRQLRDEEKRALRQTSLQMFNAGDGMTRGRFLIPTAQAGILTSVLEGISSPRSNSRRFLRTDTDGEHSDAAVGRLSLPQRWGRAFLELLEHLPGDALPQHGGLAATVTINIDFDKLRNEIGKATLSTGDSISASQARRFACNAQLLPIVLSGDSAMLDLGMSARIYDRYQRVALARRDQGCCWKGCDRPPSWCEAHHLIWASHDGPTDLANGALFCFFHHHLLHDGEWNARMGSDGIVEVIPPKRIDPTQKPIRHARFRQRNALLTT